jgi:putative addiction module killer protein
LGNFGDCKLIKGGEGVSELRIDYGPGYRIYFGKDKATIVALLIGGNKGSQTRDIAKAKRYWLDYKESLDEKE